MNDYLEKLDNILLSESVREKFLKAYKDDSFKNYLLNILPEVEDCRVTKQDNPWHVYDCLTHILKSVEVMNSLTNGMEDKDRRVLHISQQSGGQISASQSGWGENCKGSTTLP